MRIEQYFLMTDYALWEVIVNGYSPPPKRTVDGVEQTYPPTTAEEKLARKNELKAHSIEKRFGGNKELKKTQKTLLKQQYENFNGSRFEGLDQTYDKLQKLISQLEILGETISQEDMNLKAPRENKNREPIRRNVTVETTKTIRLCGLKLDLVLTGVSCKEGPTTCTYGIYIFSSLSSSAQSLSSTSYTGNFMPSKPNLILVDEEEYVFNESKPKSVSESIIKTGYLTVRMR
ncbi:hypothetical protein Tco_0495801 [Tanacetum coccineum]